MREVGSRLVLWSWHTVTFISSQLFMRYQHTKHFALYGGSIYKINIPIIHIIIS